MSVPAFHRQGTVFPAAVVLLVSFVLLIAGCRHKPLKPVTQNVAGTEIILLTINDLHGRLEPFTVQTDRGTQFVGGFAGLAAQMDQLTLQNPNAVLRLNSGDTLTGPYAAQFNGKALFGGLSRMNIDAATLGNHDFDRGPQALAQALESCSFPTVVTNIDISPEHALTGLLEPHLLFNRAGKRLLLIGLLTPKLQDLSSPGSGITMLDPGGAEVQARIRNIITEHKPDLVIALTHLDPEEDLLLARNIPEIDVISGGHSHEMTPPGEEFTIKHAGGRQTVIVQSGARGIALGVLRIRLYPDSQPAYTWQPRKIDASSAQSPRMLDFIGHYRSRLQPARSMTMIDREVDCRISAVRSREMPVGNFIADTLRAYFNTDVALYNGGGIRGDYVLPAGPITSMDVETILPFNNEAVVLNMPGAMLKQVLEHSVSHLPQPWGGFLQVSGLRMRVVPETRNHEHSSKNSISVAIRRADGTYHPLEEKKTYRIVTNSFLAGGGNGYDQLKNARVEPTAQILVRDIIMRRLAARPRHSFTADGRISIQTGTQTR